MRPLVLPVCAALALVAACRTEGGPPPNGGSAVIDVNPLRLDLLLQQRVRAGEPVSFRLRVENVSRRALDLYLRGRTITIDVVVSRAAGPVVWRRLEGEIIPAIVQLRPLSPGERLEVEATWDQRTNDGKPVEPGEYVAEGLLLVEGEPLRTPARPFTIVGR